MATRATYNFKRGQKTYKVYIHWDGYPAGAATYFTAMLEHSNGRVKIESFLRANERAELTESEHGDTEYDYTIDPDGHLIVKHRDADDKWKILDSTSLAVFLTAHDEHQSVKDVWCKVDGRTISKTMAAKELQDAIKEAADYRKRFPNHTGNQTSLDATVAKLSSLLETFEDSNIIPFAKRLTNK